MSLDWAGDTASILAFATAAVLSTTVYVIAPALVIKAASKKVPLLLSMIFAQHKRLMELEKRIKEEPRLG